jgi:hypothetical protein
MFKTKKYKGITLQNSKCKREIQEALIGLILGDLYLSKRSFNSKTSLCFKQSTKNEAYILHLYSFFRFFYGTANIRKLKMHLILVKYIKVFILKGLLNISYF